MRLELSTVGFLGQQGLTGDIAGFHLSPNGRRVAMLVQSSDGQRGIWVRSMDGDKAERVSGTERSAWIQWSPDSRFIAFVADRKLKKVDPATGSIQVISDAPSAPGLAWNGNSILFSSADRVLVLVPDSGGDPKPVTKLDASRKETAHVLPMFLPDGKHFLFAAASLVPENIGIFVASLDSQTAPTRVMPLQRLNAAGFLAPDHLFLLAEGKLTVQRFNTSALKLEGDPVTVAEDIEPGFTASDTGILAFRKSNVSEANKQLVWFDRDGKQIGQVGEPANYGGIDLSPMEDRLAVDITANNNRDIWVVDLARSVTSRITYEPTSDWSASWSPDGKYLGYASAGRPNAPTQIYRKASSGVGGEELVSGDNDNSIAVHWSPDDKYILFSRAKNGLNNTWLQPLFGDRKPKPFLESPFDKIQARVSPDSRWVAYTTNETGMFQVVVQSFPDANGGKWQISADGGVEPKWRGDGRELYYLALDGKLMSVPLKVDRTIEAGRPVALFQTSLAVNRTRPDRDRRYDVTKDGKRFLIVAPIAKANSTPLTLLVNWQAILKQ
jgi:Tol biopolymer transport system component